MIRAWYVTVAWACVALSWLLVPGWRAVVITVVFLVFAAVSYVLAPPRGAHADRAALNLGAPNVGWPGSMALEDDQGAWLAELESRGYIGGWESGACDPGPKVERWPAHDDPHWLPPAPETPAVADGLVLLGRCHSPAGDGGAGGTAPAPPPSTEVIAVNLATGERSAHRVPADPIQWQWGPGNAAAPPIDPGPPTTLAGHEARADLAEQDADARAYLDQLAYSLAAHAYRCLATLKGQQ